MKLLYLSLVILAFGTANALHIDKIVNNSDVEWIILYEQIPAPRNLDQNNPLAKYFKEPTKGQLQWLKIPSKAKLHDIKLPAWPDKKLIIGWERKWADGVGETNMRTQLAYSDYKSIEFTNGQFVDQYRYTLVR